jgi:hypothetical protein
MKRIPTVPFALQPCSELWLGIHIGIWPIILWKFFFLENRRDMEEWPLVVQTWTGGHSEFSLLAWLKSTSGTISISTRFGGSSVPEISVGQSKQILGLISEIQWVDVSRVCTSQKMYCFVVWCVLSWVLVVPGGVYLGTCLWCEGLGGWVYRVERTKAILISWCSGDNWVGLVSSALRLISHHLPLHLVWLRYVGVGCTLVLCGFEDGVLLDWPGRSISLCVYCYGMWGLVVLWFLCGFVDRVVGGKRGLRVRDARDGIESSQWWGVTRLTWSVDISVCVWFLCGFVDRVVGGKCSLHVRDDRDGIESSQWWGVTRLTWSVDISVCVWSMYKKNFFLWACQRLSFEDIKMKF